MKKTKKLKDVFTEMDARHKERMKLFRLMLDAAPNEKARKKIVKDEVTKAVREIRQSHVQTTKRMAAMRQKWKDQAED